MPQLPKEKLFGIYRGVCENNVDPTESGRCQIRIFGLHTDNKKINLLDSVPTENLVWVMPCTPIFGGISQVGIYGIPCQGAHVFVFFENGNIMQPRYFATAPGIPSVPSNPDWGFFDPDGIYPKAFDGEPDWNKGTTKDAYGDIFVIEDKGGNKIVLDSKTGSEKIYIQAGGSVKPQLILNSNGSLTRHSGDGTDETFTGAQKTVVGGDSTNIITGNNSVSSGGTKITTLGNHSEYISGPADVTVTGIENRVSGGLAWNSKGDSSIMAAGEAAYVSDGPTTVKSNTMSVKLKATLMNIEMTALLGEVSSTSLRTSIMATTMASFQGLLTTSLGGGLITNVDGLMTTVTGTAICKITGGIVMIG
jgi:hypothetical protein